MCPELVPKTYRSAQAGESRTQGRGLGKLRQAETLDKGMVHVPCRTGKDGMRFQASEG